MRSTILGIEIDRLDKKQALHRVSERIDQKKYTAIYTPNPVIIQRAAKDPLYLRAVNRGHINLPDGIGVILAARLLELPLSRRVAGIEFGEALLTLAEERGLRVFLLGARPTVAARAAQKLKEKHPRLAICGAHHGYFRDERAKDVVEKIEAARTDILLVCLGAPRQEFFIDSHRPRGVLVAAALGGSLDVWAGNVTRAPALISRVGLEWLWRICLEPRRLRHLPDLLGFALAVVGEKVKISSPKTISHTIFPHKNHTK